MPFEFFENIGIITSLPKMTPKIYVRQLWELGQDSFTISIEYNNKKYIIPTVFAIDYVKDKEMTVKLYKPSSDNFQRLVPVQTFTFVPSQGSYLYLSRNYYNMVTFSVTKPFSDSRACTLYMQDGKKIPAYFTQDKGSKETFELSNVLTPYPKDTMKLSNTTMKSFYVNSKNTNEIFKLNDNLSTDVFVLEQQ